MPPHASPTVTSEEVTLDGKNSQHSSSTSYKHPLIPTILITCLLIPMESNLETLSITPCLRERRACPMACVSPKTHLARAYMCIVYVLVVPRWILGAGAGRGMGRQCAASSTLEHCCQLRPTQCQRHPCSLMAPSQAERTS
jgi:hypothetical protein